jgi:ABC-type multidrug transport system fused ATPase/permease subunit
LFSGTIKENICYGIDLDKVTDAMLDEACEKSNALSFVKDKKVMPEGYNTRVGERGI